MYGVSHSNSVSQVEVVSREDALELVQSAEEQQQQQPIGHAHDDDSEDDAG